MNLKIQASLVRKPQPYLRMAQNTGEKWAVESTLLADYSGVFQTELFAIIAAVEGLLKSTTAVSYDIFQQWSCLKISTFQQ